MRENKFRKWIRTEIETEAEALEKKALEPDGQKWKAKLNLDRIYLEGLLKNLKDTDKKRYEKIKTEII